MSPVSAGRIFQPGILTLPSVFTKLRGSFIAAACWPRTVGKAAEGCPRQKGKGTQKNQPFDRADRLENQRVTRLGIAYPATPWLLSKLIG